MRFYAVLLGVAVLSGTAWADSRSEVLKEVAKCADVASAAERLKCFDAAVPHAQAALATPEPPPSQAQATQTEGEGGGVLGWFGFERPVTKTEDFGKPPAKIDGPKEITTLAANVAEFGRTPSGRALFILDNGQVWRQIDGDVTAVSDPPSGGQLKVAIEKAFFGSYALTIDGRNGLIKVRRVK